MKRALVASILTVMVLVAGFAHVETAEASMAAYDAYLHDSNIKIKQTMKAGQKYRVSVKVQNSGDIKWEGRRFRLHSRIHKGPSGSSMQRDELTPIIYLKGVLHTGEWYTFYYDVEAPAYTGKYTLEWTMMRGSSNFGDLGTLPAFFLPSSS